MKKFILGYMVGSILSALVTDYIVRSEIYINLNEKKRKNRGY